MSTGENIKKARKKACLTQKALAEALGVSPQMISLYENDERNPKYGTLEKIADAITRGSGGRVHVSVRDLFEGDGIGYISSLMMDIIDREFEPPEIRLKKYFESVDEEGKEKIAQYAEDIAGNPHYSLFKDEIEGDE